MLAFRCKCGCLQGWINHPTVTLIIEFTNEWKTATHFNQEVAVASSTSWHCPRPQCNFLHVRGYGEINPREYLTEKIND